MAIPYNRKTGRLVIIIIGVVYFLSAKGYIEIIDTGYSILTAEALLTKGTLSLDIPFTEMFTFVGKHGHIYSKYGIGLPLYYLPWIAAGHFLSSLTGMPEREISGFLISFSNIPVALLSLILFRKLLRLFEIHHSYLILLLAGLGMGTLVWRYSVYDFSEEIQMLLILCAVYGIIRNSPSSNLLSGIGFSGLILFKLVYIAFLPLFLVYMMTRSSGEKVKRIHTLLRFIIPVFISIVFILLLNQLRFGNAFESGYGHESSRFNPLQLLHTIPSLLFSLDKGLFLFCPLLLLSFLGWKNFFRQHKAEALLCLSLILINLFLSGAWWSWTGGWCYGPRLLVPFIPLYLLPVCFWLGKDVNQRRFVITLIFIVISIIVQIPGILVKDQQIHHIKEISLTPEEKKYAPSDYETTIKLLSHKIKNGDEIYNISEFGIPGNRQFSLSEYKTYQGFNVWSEQLAEHLHKPAIRFVPLVITMAGIFYLLFLWKIKST